MADIERQHIKSIYSQIKGALGALPTKAQVMPDQPAQNYNKQLAELTVLTRSDYRAHRLTNIGGMFLTDEARMSMSSVVSRLESDFGFEPNQSSGSSAPVIVTVNQSQQLSVSVQTISQLISEQVDETLKSDLEELNTATESRDREASKKILATIASKSWDVFIKVLPYLLEQWGRQR